MVLLQWFLLMIIYDSGFSSLNSNDLVIMSMTFQSGLCPNQVDYINAHATSTPIGTKIETSCWFALVLRLLNL